jgi:large subunit ribosomal protein L5
MADEKKTPPPADKAEKEKEGKAAKATKAKGPKGPSLVGEAAPAPKGYIPRLRKSYTEQIAPALQKDKKYPNIMAVPRVEKISINMGIGEAKSDVKVLEEALYVITMISGQKPAQRRSKKSIANFKLRENVIIGLSVTLRGPRMYEFMDRFINLSLPRVRDFSGIDPNGFDGRGNFTMGLRDPLIFPEVDYNMITKPLGMNITFVTSARTDAEGRELLTRFGMPFRKIGAAA